MREVIFLLLLLGVLGAPRQANAEAAPERESERAHHLVKGHFTASYNYYGSGIEYEYLFTDWFSLGGEIAPMLTFAHGRTIGFGVNAHFMTTGTHKMAGGVGVLVPFAMKDFDPVESTFPVLPVITLGYRYQPRHAGFFFETGAYLSPIADAYGPQIAFGGIF